jgi:APA family basic amino acid/polyamine antiporter
LIGGMGTFTAWIVVMALNPRTLLIGAGWMVLGISVYLAYRRYQGLPVTETVKVDLLEPLGVEEIEYRSVLVPFEDTEPFSEQTVATAVRLAAKRRRGIHIIAVLTVPRHLPLDAPLEEQEREVRSKIEQAKLIGGTRVTGHVHRVRPDQAGHSIAEEAGELKASALVMGLRYRNGTPVYTKTLETVLAERPCRVLVIAEPDRARHRVPRTEPIASVTGSVNR